MQGKRKENPFSLYVFSIIMVLRRQCIGGGVRRVDPILARICQRSSPASLYLGYPFSHLHPPSLLIFPLLTFFTYTPSSRVVHMIRSEKCPDPRQETTRSRMPGPLPSLPRGWAPRSLPSDWVPSSSYWFAIFPSAVKRVVTCRTCRW